MIVISFCFLFTLSHYFGIVVVTTLFTFLFPERRTEKQNKTSQHVSDGIITDGLGNWHAVCSFHLLLWRPIMKTVSSLLLASCMLTGPSYCVSALLSWQQNHVMFLRSWQQCKSLLLLRRNQELTLFFTLDLCNAKHLKSHYTQDKTWKDDQTLLVRHNGV